MNKLSKDYQHLLDTTGLRCPIPMLKAKKALTAMQAGEILKIVSTDPATVQDFESLLQVTGDQLLQWEQIENKYYFLILKK